MLPKTHAILGIILSILIYIIFKITYIEAFLIFFASVFIDFDHYLWFILKKKDFSLKNAYNMHKMGYQQLKKDRSGYDKNPLKVLHIFHTVEFLIIVLILSYFWNGFLFLLIGMVFHILLDMVEMVYSGFFYSREYFLTRYLINDKKKYY